MMKKIILILITLLSANLLQAQTVKHAKGVKSVQALGSIRESGYVLQPGFGYYIHNRVQIGGNLFYENYNKNNITGTTLLLKPQISFSLVNISNILYINISAGINVGKQDAKTSITSINSSTNVQENTSGLVVGGNAGINAEVFIYKGLALHGGMEYVGVPNWIFGDNNFHPYFGLVYNFKYF